VTSTISEKILLKVRTEFRKPSAGTDSLFQTSDSSKPRMLQYENVFDVEVETLILNSTGAPTTLCSFALQYGFLTLGVRKL
jgi:hypothetical protein